MGSRVRGNCLSDVSLPERKALTASRRAPENWKGTSRHQQLFLRFQTMAKKTKSRYELKEKLGEGGMGVVRRAFDTVLNTDVALKVLLDGNDATALKLFYEECHKQSSLAHPNIVEVRDVGSFDEDGVRQPYLVMPLLRGVTLASIIRSSRSRSQQSVASISSPRRAAGCRRHTISVFSTVMSSRSGSAPTIKS
jgi:serine/threonine protein kinase